MRAGWISGVVVALWFLAGCGVKPLEPVRVEAPQQRVDYLASVKPILDKRCVSCHSCYNAPCQLKLSSFEGLERGGSKAVVYNGERLQAMDPTRLFTDAKTASQWRDKGFFSVTDNRAASGFNDSTMLQFLSHKMRHPVSHGAYYPEADDLTCARNGEELSEYLEENPQNGMPFGFPPLTQREFRTLAAWLQQGAPGPDATQQKKLTTPSTVAAGQIGRWEAFFNQGDPKHVVTARYLYEHLYLAHILFDGAPGEYYELVRSTTPSGEPVAIIPTVRPFDDPGSEPFYYRFRKIHSTIVHKTHMLFRLDDTVMARFKELFIQPEWIETPHVVGYDAVASANPFVTFGQIPTRSRYQFLLDNSHYMIMTFIRGPVCKGQIALNVIHDHFWVMFMDPDADLSVQRPLFISEQAENLRMPIESGPEVSVWRTFSDRYKERAEAYYEARRKLYAQVYEKGLGLDAIWRGERPEDAPMLTVYRHFDSASVHKGPLGELPRTLWVIDYPLFERIYYALVAGFDVFGNVGHQTNIRRYMDNLRTEGESYFTDFLPAERRREVFSSWYVGSDTGDEDEHRLAEFPTAISYYTSDVKRELTEKVVEEHLLPETGIGFDAMNYFHTGDIPPELPEHYHTAEDYIQAFRAISLPGTAFISEINGHNSNLAYLRIKLPRGEDKVISIVINRWHDNVDFLFGEENRLDPTKDTADFIPGFIGSYPNFFLEVDADELPGFFELLANYRDTPEDKWRLYRYGIGRENPRFWDVFDWFQARFEKEQPVRAGLLDLNRYYYDAGPMPPKLEGLSLE